jgi:hypothetical protein
LDFSSAARIGTARTKVRSRFATNDVVKEILFATLKRLLRQNRHLTDITISPNVRFAPILLQKSVERGLEA